ncbi:hypothetical protein I79_020011 [Cricetulus griseus]|uniref:Uncharacterized protein n=1 Tax=Cricetulus griseus TaxID=10029 RepID=G3I8X8_CRIGR|nr:hypothetical protein I79_020011 [Cricetulus griseus]
MVHLVISCIARELHGVTALSRPLSTVPNIWTGLNNIWRGFNKRWPDAWLIPSK